MQTEAAAEALKELARLIETAVYLPVQDMTQQDKEQFSREHPGAFVVIGDFEIKCLNPQKYNL